MSLKNDAFPASAAFDSIAAALKDETEKKDAIKKGGAVFCFTLKNAAGQTDSWFIDLKQTGAVGKGEAPSGGKADSSSFSSLPRENYAILTSLSNCPYIN
ncbi:hypothetical protein TWF594_009662 [Orbilia oligospora]|nr:hypothetical protein TWF594_009662 [Orbilia oligospora]